MTANKMTNTITYKDLEARLKEAKKAAKARIKILNLGPKYKEEMSGVFEKAPEYTHVTMADRAYCYLRAYLNVFSQQDVSDELIREAMARVGLLERTFGQRYQAAQAALTLRAEGRTFVR